MIKLTITGQTLSIVTSKVVAGTHDYLEVEGDFRTPDWRNLRKWVHFIQLDQHYILPMHEDRISAEQHLDLTGGTWDVYVHGNYIDDDEVTERVTTGIRYLWVEGPHEGKPFPPLTPEFEEVLANEVEQALDIAQSVRDDADAGEFDGATYLPNVDEEGNISWTNDQEKPNPETRNIMGPRGPVGPTTVMVSETPPEEDRINVWIDPRGQVGKVIVSWELISGTHQPGTYDTYLVTFQDGSDLTIQIYNGADGEGTGDMLKNVYDPNNIASDVFAYADDAAEDVKDTTDVTGLLKGSGGNIVRAVPGTDYQAPLTIDDELSDTSTNPVENQAIKQYIDENASKIFYVTYNVTTFAEISAAINAGKMPVLNYAKKYLPLNIYRGIDEVDHYCFTDTLISIDSSETTGPIIVTYFVSENDVWSQRPCLVISSDEINTSLNSYSEWPAQTKVIYQALNGKQDKLTIDSAMSGTSTNPVQNKAIKQYVDSKIPSGDMFIVEAKTAQVNITQGSNLLSIPITKSGYTPLGVVGFDAGLSNFTVFAVGNGPVNAWIEGMSEYNIPAPTTISVNILYKKN